MQIPAAHQTVMPYLILKNANGFLEFTQRVFGAALTHRSLREDGVTLAHCEIQIGGCTLMFAEATDAFSVQAGGFFIYVENADATFAQALAAGATVIMSLSDQPYGRSGGVLDPFGVTWWITAPPVSGLD